MMRTPASTTAKVMTPGTPRGWRKGFQRPQTSASSMMISIKDRLRYTKTYLQNQNKKKKKKKKKKGQSAQSRQPSESKTNAMHIRRVRLPDGVLGPHGFIDVLPVAFSV